MQNDKKLKAFLRGAKYIFKPLSEEDCFVIGNILSTLGIMVAFGFLVFGLLIFLGVE